MSWLDQLILSGASGPTGGNAYSLTSASFTVPASGSNVTVSVVTGSWMVAGQVVFIAGAGYYTVVSATATSCVLTNLGTAANAAPSTVISSGAGITPAGAPGILNGPPASDANTIGLWQTTDLAGATSWPNDATGAGAITGALVSALANGTATPAYAPAAARSNFLNNTYPSVFNLDQEAGPRVTVTTAPSTSSATTIDCFFRPFTSGLFAAGAPIFGYRLTTATNISTLTASDWSFCIFSNATVTGADLIDWGIAFTTNVPTSIKSVASANWGSNTNYFLQQGVVCHLGLVVYQAGGNTGYQIWKDGVKLVDLTVASSSLQNIAYNNSREIVMMAGYPSLKTSCGWVSNCRISNIQRTASYFAACANAIP